MALSYFFEARVKIPRAAWDAFEVEFGPNVGQKVVDLLENPGGLVLAHAAYFPPNDNFPFYFFYNFWKLGVSANNLAEAERKLADKVIWAKFIKLLDREEEKDLMYPLTRVLQADPDVLGVPLPTARYLRIQYDIQHYAVAEMQARLEAEVAREGKRLGWYLGNSYMLHTGREGRMVQIWLVPPTLTQMQATVQAGSLSWLRPIPPTNSEIIKWSTDNTPLDVKLFNRSPFDPNPPKVVLP
jgi:hypothetical protein